MTLDDRHPDAERLSEYADDVLELEARAEVEQHLADCGECRAVLAETMAFLHAHPTTDAGTTAGRILPFRARRWWAGVAAGLAAAAGLVLAVRVLQPEWVSGLFPSRSDRPELQELIAAVADEPRRPVEARLTGGFRYAPPPSVMRGPADGRVSAEVLIAAATLEQHAAADPSPAMEAALGVALLVQGDFDRAIDALERAVGRQPERAHFQNDLAAAYLERARTQNRADDLPRADAAAGRAIQLSPAMAEAWFNRALALEALGRREDAARAWQEAIQYQQDPLWRDEARSHLDALMKPPR